MRTQEMIKLIILQVNIHYYHTLENLQVIIRDKKVIRRYAFTSWCTKMFTFSRNANRKRQGEPIRIVAVGKTRVNKKMSF